MKKIKTPNGYSFSDDYLNNRNTAPSISALAANSVSQYRKQILTEEVAHGIYKDGSGPNFTENGLTNLGNVVSSGKSIRKNAQALTNNAGSGNMGFGDAVYQNPEIYSPLWLNSNLSLPRDRATINAWCRAFFALNPLVHNAIQLHSTYPISKLSIKCPDPKIKQFFDDMIEELDLMNICVQIAQEYWLLGEAFIYAELEGNKGKWSRLLIQNPDFMVVSRSVVDDEPTILLRPDQNLKRIVSSNKSADIEQRKHLNPYVIDCIKRGQNIVLNNMYITHLARKIAPYEIRGTGLPVCIFRQLMLFDRLRECYDQETEVLTDNGFKKISDLVEKIPVNKENDYFQFGAIQENSDLNVLGIKKSIKIATVNQKTKNIEYQTPQDFYASYYKGEMHHYIGKKVDVCVSPNHKMWARQIKYKNNKQYYSDPELIKSSDLIKIKKWHKLSNICNWNGKTINSVKILDQEVPIEIYLKTLGHMISEGCVYTNFKNNRHDALITMSQITKSPYYDEIKTNFNKFADIFNKKCLNRIIPAKSEINEQEKWDGRINGKDLSYYFEKEIGKGAANKKIPQWVLELNSDLLKILLNALIQGDGSYTKSKYNVDTIKYSYTTISKELCDNVSELVFKCGYYPNIIISNRNNRNEYNITWSNTHYGSEPVVYPENTGNGGSIKKISYNGFVWCFEVDNGLFITRRNGKISVQGNSKFAQADEMINPWTLIKIGSDGPDGQHPGHADLEAWREIFEAAANNKNFKIFTHPGVAIEKIGTTPYDISGDVQQLIKEIYIGLQVPQVLMDGGADTTYANGGVALDVLRQRYMQLRNMLAIFLKRKIFAPISRLNNFYTTSGGKKHLIVPDVDWNHMSLFDAGDYIANMISLTQPGQDGSSPRASMHSLYRSMGLDWDEEQRRIRKEAIQNEIHKKEIQALTNMSLDELRSFDEDEDIPATDDKKEPPVPGQQDQIPGLDTSLSGSLPPPSTPPPPPPPLPNK